MKCEMNILSVSGHLGNDAYSWRVQNISKQLGTQGHNVRLAEIPSLYARNWISRGIILAKYEAKHLGELSHRAYDLVYGNSGAAFYCLLGKLKGVPLVFDMHGLSVEEYLLHNATIGGRAKVSLDYFGRLMTERMDLRLSDTIVCVSKTQMRLLSKSYRIPQEKMIYATNGVDVDYFRPRSTAEVRDLRVSLGLDRRIVFGYIGGIDKNNNNWWGVQQMIKAAQTIRDPEVGFLLVGGRESYRSGNLVMVQRQPRDRLNEYYAACDVLVLPIPKHASMSIASPTKFAEYAAVGRPIISTDTGDPPEFIRTNDCGIVISDLATDTIVEGIMRCKEMPSGRLSTMGAKSRRLAERDFDWGKIGANLSNALLRYEG